MSQENVEVVRRVWSLFAERVAQGDEAVAALTSVFDEGFVAPESTFTPVREVPGSRTYVGREGLVEFFLAWTEEWDEWTVWLEEIVGATGDRVVAVVHQSARGKGSGVAVENRFWIVYTIGAGQVIDQVHYLDRDDALEAAGLSE